MSDRGAIGGRWGCPQGTRGAAQTIILSLLLTTAAFAGRAVPCPLGNLSQRTGGFGTTDAETTFFDHGPRGELRRLTQPTSGGNRPASVFEYPDDSHRLSKVTRGTDVVSFDYDGNSTRVSAVKKGSGVPLDATVSRFYTSPTRRLSSLTGAWGTTDVAWEPGGARLRSLNGGLADETFCFDGPGRIQSIDTGGGNCPSPSSSVRVYSYDGRGNPRTEAFGGVTRHFGYDAADRLTSSTDWSGVSTILSLHPDGTRNTELVGGELHTYDYDSNTGALSAVRNGSTTLASWSYLNDGRVSSRTIGSSTSTYAWDGFGRLVSATSSAGTSTFEYDALGLRRASSLNGVPTSSLTWVGESQVAEGSELVSSVGPFLLSQGNVRFTHDALGSIVGQSKLQPAPLLPLTSSAAYGTWGAQSGGTQLTSNSHAGQRLESALGLVENQQRWRDPIFGVWLSRDSVGAASYLGSPNGVGPWSYANLNPLRYVDPDGRRGCFPGEEHTTCEARLIATGGIEGSAFRPSVPTTFVHPLEAQSQRAMAKVEQTKRHMFVAAGVGLTLAGGAGIALLAAEGGLSFGGFMALSMSTEAASGALIDKGLTGEVHPETLLMSAVLGPLGTAGQVPAMRGAILEYQAGRVGTELSTATIESLHVEAREGLATTLSEMQSAATRRHTWARSEQAREAHEAGMGLNPEAFANADRDLANEPLHLAAGSTTTEAHRLDLVRMRAELGLPPATGNAKEQGGVLTKFVFESGDEVFGINTWAGGDAQAAAAYRKAGFVVPLSETATGAPAAAMTMGHAEGDSFLQAFIKGLGRKGGEADLFIDAARCGTCANNVGPLGRRLGLDRLRVHELQQDGSWAVKSYNY